MPIKYQGMIPITNPLQYPAILAIGLFLTIFMGIPTILLSLLIFFVIERIPFRMVRLILPLAGAALMVSVSLIYFGGVPRSPEEYQTTWIPMMLTSFLLNALVILAPFPFIRKHVTTYSPYLVIPVTLVVTFFLLVAFGFMGGDAQIPPDTEYEMMKVKLYFVIAEFVFATLVYGCIALLGTVIPGGLAEKE